MQNESNINNVQDTRQNSKIKRLALPREPLSAKQIQAVLAIADPEWTGIIKVGKCTGQRLSDIARLRWKDVDPQERLIRFPAWKTSRPKEVGIPHALDEVLLNVQKPENADSPIFPRAFELAMRNWGALEYQFVAMQVRAKLKPWKFHLLRVTLLKNLCAQGFPVLTMRRLFRNLSQM
jgi:integrase